MLSYFTSNKAVEMRTENLHYEERFKDFHTNFSIALPKLAIAKLRDLARHTNAKNASINITKLAEAYHNDNGYKNYAFVFKEKEHNEYLTILKEYLTNEKFEVREETNKDGFKEIIADWSKTLE